MSCLLLGRCWGGPGKALVKAVTAAPLRVHVHLLMQLHVNGAMIRFS